jgi:hypothetical protein
MRKRLLAPIVAGSLLLVAIVIAVAARFVYPSNPTANQHAEANAIVSVFTVLQAHCGYNDKEWLRFTGEGTLMYNTDISAGLGDVFERRLRFSTDGSSVRYDKGSLNRSQSFLFNGHTLLKTTFEAGTKTEVRVLDSVEAASIRFQLATFGLLPVLKRLSNPSAQVVYIGPTSQGDRFQVKTASGSWYFYTDRNHLIDRLEIGNINITYADYRTVDGLNLPFHQSVTNGDRLLYEIKFDALDLNPVFAAGFFNSQLL